MNGPTFQGGKYYDENGNHVDKQNVKGRYLGHHCGNELCDCRPASMWDAWKCAFVCAACAKEINTMVGYERCVEPPKS